MTMTDQIDREASIELRDIAVERGGEPIIHDLSLSIRRGEVFGVIGPSGSGKTTLIRGLLGLSPISAGSARVLDWSPGDAALRSKIGYLPQDAAIYPDLSARENLEFFAAIYRTRRERVDALLTLLDIEAIADRVVATYSGGQRQRVALAAALIPEPKILLLDEPTVGLDPRLRVHLWETFRRLAADGATLVVTTHVMDEAEKCDRIAFIMGGSVVATGTPAELKVRAGVDDLESAVLALTDPERQEVQHVG
jgi:ABC-2 type transport system ATP-binding protein